jgi:hypothetical protein
MLSAGVAFQQQFLVFSRVASGSQATVSFGFHWPASFQRIGLP